MKPIQLTQTRLKQMVGATSFARGKEYYRSGRITHIALEITTEDGYVVSGTVLGSRNKTYHTDIFADAYGGELYSTCTCPMEYDCKHVAALGLAALAQYAGSINGTFTLANEAAEREMPESTTHSSAQAARPTPSPAAPSADWRTMLEQATRSADAHARATPPGKQKHAETPPSLPSNELQILITVIRGFGELLPAHATVPDGAETQQIRLALRPRVLQYAHYGPEQKNEPRPSLTALQWHHLQSYGGRVDLRYSGISENAGQFFVALGEALGVDRVFERVRWMPLLDERAWFTFEAMRRHREYGVRLYAGEKQPLPVTVSDTPLIAQLHITDDPKHKSYTLTRIFSVNGTAYPPDQILLIGDPPVCAAVADTAFDHFDHARPFSFTLHPVEQAVPPAHFQKGVAVPRQQRQHFIHNYLPKLTRLYHVHSEAPGISVPERTHPDLVVEVGPHRTGKTKEEGTSDTQRPLPKLRVSLSFDYGGTRVPFGHTKDLIGGGDSRKIITDPAAEQALAEQLAISANWSEPLSSSYRLEGLTAARFMTDIMPTLQNTDDIRVEVDPETPAFSRETTPPELSFSLEEEAPSTPEYTSDEISFDADHTGASPARSETDWFDLQISVTIGDEEVPFGQLFTALAAGEEELLLPSGTFFRLDHPEFDRLRELINEARGMTEVTEQGVKLSRFQAGFWEELSKLGIVEQQAEAWQTSVEALLSSRGAPRLQLPRHLSATLRDYQKDGYSWLSFLSDLKLGGVLADDMGLGKTLQALALVVRNRERASANTEKSENAPGKTTKKGKRGQSRDHEAPTSGLAPSAPPALVVAPTSVVENWDSECEVFAPALKRVVMRRGDRRDAYADLPTADIVVTSYALLMRDFDTLKQYHFDTLILDEAQFVKNFQSRAYSCIRRLHAERRFALTGTPMENNLMELWSIFSIVTPGLFATKPETFRAEYQKPIEKTGSERGGELMHQLRRRIRPFFMRRTKERVEKDLPEKTETTLTIEMSPQHRKIYELHLQRERQKMLELLEKGGLQQNRFQILKSLTRMRQLALAPSLLDQKEYTNVPASKLEAFREQIHTIVGEGHKVLVFSQFTKFLSLVRDELNNANISHLYLDGSTPAHTRKKRIETFQEQSDYPVFVISLKAGGVGLNLTAADYCFILDPWWNPATENQAVDRVHRIGQTKHVMVYRMITKNTIEEKVRALQERKRALFENLTQDNEQAFASLLTEDDIKDLFSV